MVDGQTGKLGTHVQLAVVLAFNYELGIVTIQLQWAVGKYVKETWLRAHLVRQNHVVSIEVHRVSSDQLNDKNNV